eukprot:281533-Amphidinium_carterae.1
MLREQNRLSTLWQLPAFHTDMVRIDWLHAVDQGIAAKLFGAVMHMAIGRGDYGLVQEARAKHVFKLMLAFYKSSGVTNDRLKLLPIKRFKQPKQRPVLKASAGQIKALVPFFKDLVLTWPVTSKEVAQVRIACVAMHECYSCLATGDDAKPAQHLAEQALVAASAM